MPLVKAEEGQGGVGRVGRRGPVSIHQNPGDGVQVPSRTGRGLDLKGAVVAYKGFPVPPFPSNGAASSASTITCEDSPSQYSTRHGRPMAIFTQVVNVFLWG